MKIENPFWSTVLQALVFDGGYIPREVLEDVWLWYAHTRGQSPREETVDTINQRPPEGIIKGLRGAADLGPSARQMLFDQLSSAEREAEDLRVLLGMLPSEMTYQQNDALARLLAR